MTELQLAQEMAQRLDVSVGRALAAVKLLIEKELIEVSDAT